MTPNIAMTSQEEIIYLIPYILEDYPREAMTIALVHQDEQSTASVFGPVARKPLARLENNWQESAGALIEQFNGTDVFFVAYVNDLEETLTNSDLARQMNECALATQKALDERYRRDDMGFVSAYITDYKEWISVNTYNPSSTTDEHRQRGLIGSNEDFKDGQMAAEIAYAGYAVPEQDRVPNITSEECERADDAYVNSHTNARGKKAVQALFAGRATAEDYGIAGQLLDDFLTRDRLIYASLAGLDVAEVWTMEEDELDTCLAQTTTTAPNIIERARMFDTIAGHLPNTNAAALSCSAYLRWWAGERASAHARATDAIYNNPGYNLARLVLHAIDLEIDSPAQQ
ncbi:DUF4192 family protein [Trueperella pyogenes]